MNNIDNFEKIEEELKEARDAAWVARNAACDAGYAAWNAADAAWTESSAAYAAVRADKGQLQYQIDKLLEVL